MRPHPLFRMKTGLRWIAALTFGLLPMHVHGATDAPDFDDDGIPNAPDDNVDGGIARCGPSTGQHLGDHVNDDNPAGKDIDCDQMSDADPLELDTDGDRRADNSGGEHHIDGDGRLDDDSAEDDIDGDSLDEDDLVELDVDGDNSMDSSDSDIDGDSKSNSALDEDDTDGDGRLNADADQDDADGDGMRNREDGDDDNDGLDGEEDDDHHNGEDEAEVGVDLTPTSAASDHREARVSLQRMATGTIKLKLDASDFKGAYDIVIGGVARGTLVLTGSSGKAFGERQLKNTSTTSGEYLPLDFEVINQPISIELGGVACNSGTIPTPPDPLPSGGPVEPPVTAILTQVLTAASDTSSQAEAKVVVDIGLGGGTEVEIEAEDLPSGGARSPSEAPNVAVW